MPTCRGTRKNRKALHLRCHDDLPRDQLVAGVLMVPVPQKPLHPLQLPADVRCETIHRLVRDPVLVTIRDPAIRETAWSMMNSEARGHELTGVKGSCPVGSAVAT